MFDLVTQFVNSPITWFLFLLCGLLIGMAKTGLSGAGLMIVPIMAGIFGGKLSVGIVLPMLIFADNFAVNILIGRREHGGPKSEVWNVDLGFFLDEISTDHD